MITCPKCGADNMVGAIFCRTCAARLNLDEIEPEDIQKAGKSGKSALASTVKRIVVVSFVLLFAYVIIALMLPAASVELGDIESAAVKRAVNKYRWMKQPNNRYHTFSFTSAEATAVANRIFGIAPGSAGSDEEETGEGGLSGAKKPTHMSVQFLSGDWARFALKSDLFGVYPLYSVLEVRFTVTGRGLELTPTAAHAGRLPCPGTLRNLVISQFEPLLEDRDELKKIQKITRALEINENTAKISLKYN